MNEEAACLIVESAAQAIARTPASVADVLASIPAPLYVADAEGTITHFNEGCIPLAGRTPEPGRDKWCVTWRLFTAEGDHLPHDQCPMAVAIRERRAVRNAEAVAERPDGTRAHFVPFPTPLYDRDGTFTGAINLLLDVTEQRTPRYLQEQAERCRRLAASSTDARLAHTLKALATAYEEQCARLTRAAGRRGPLN